MFSYLAKLIDVPAEDLRFAETGPPTLPWARETNNLTSDYSIFEP
jgi:hypothetical protein